MTLLPLLVVAVGWEIFCLIHLIRARQVRYLPKPIWALVIIISIPLGGIVYLALGRVGADDTVRPSGGHTGRAESTAGASRRAPCYPAPTACSIEINGLSKHFGPVAAVDDLTFEVRPGRVTGFLGPNGAGKTTTMRVILGLEAPTAGRTVLGGRSYRGIIRPLHEVGSLLDANAVHPARSAWQHLLSIAQSNRISSGRASTVLEAVGLASVAHRRMGQFSLGMKQRLGIAAALLGDPPILVFDEPVNGLDPEGVHWIRELFKSLAAEGRTVFVSSHLMSEMAITADHLIIIGRGRLLADTTTTAFVEANARRDVFVRSPQASRLTDLLAQEGAGVVADGADGGMSVTGMESPAIAQLAAAQGILLYELTPRHASLEEAYLDLTRESEDYRAGPSRPLSPGAVR